MQSDWEDMKDTLEAMGYRSFGDFVKGPEWAEVRAKLAKSCRVCGRRAGRVHFRRYYGKALWGGDLDSLVPLCREHHEAIQKQDGYKLTHAAQNAALDRITPRKKPKPRRNFSADRVCRRLWEDHGVSSEFTNHAIRFVWATGAVEYDLATGWWHHEPGGDTGRIFWHEAQLVELVAEAAAQEYRFRHPSDISSEI